MPSPTATRADIIAMLRDGHSNYRITRELRCDKQRVNRLRNELGLPTYVKAEQTRTLEEKWGLFTRPADGGHMEWTGSHVTASNTPVLSYKATLYSAAAIAFHIKHGREPQGYVKAECDYPHCVAPDHVEDEAGRQRLREQLRYLTGGRKRKPQCGRGHDQAEHGRYSPDGDAYCQACRTVRKRARRQAVAS